MMYRVFLDTTCYPRIRTMVDNYEGEVIFNTFSFRSTMRGNSRLISSLYRSIVGYKFE